LVRHSGIPYLILSFVICLLLGVYQSIIDFKFRFRSDIENDIEVIAKRHKAKGKIFPLHP
jgi:hypothetical protein